MTVMDGTIRHDWTVDQIVPLHDLPLLELVGRANEVHRRHHDPNAVQKASLLSIKTGGCPENCAYCPQSAHHREVDLTRDELMDPGKVIAMAARAGAAGAERFCMGAAWRQVRDGKEFDAIIEMVEGVRALGMEACVTLGMLKPHQAERLAAAGLTAYNHNLDTSPEFYGRIITTRTYEDRLETLATVRSFGIELCCGGIIGMGETLDDRVDFLLALQELAPQEVPVNFLNPRPGTPLAGREVLEPHEALQFIALTRLALPNALIRLAGGREITLQGMQEMGLRAGANGLILGNYLTTQGRSDADDFAMLEQLGFTV
jgi:biotin synthase